MKKYKSSVKCLRSSFSRKLRNNYKIKTCKTFIKKIINSSNKEESKKNLKRVFSMLDILSKKNIIHKNKASNNKSRLSKIVNNLN